MTRLVLDLDAPVPGHARARTDPALAPRLRHAARLDAADRAGHDVIVRIPETVYAVSTFFFLAATGDALRRRGARRD